MPNTPLRIGTRGSRLAIAQARLVADEILNRLGLDAELVEFVTRGDRAKGPLTEIGGKGLFTEELEQALRKGDIDLAVHSAKDLPVIIADDTLIAAVPERQDARDAIVSTKSGGVAALPSGATIGTCSFRRSAQALALRKDLVVVPLRGNVDTRISKVLTEHSLDAAILAVAGLKRAGLYEPNSSHITPLDADEFIPSAGQGSLAVQVWKENKRAMELAPALDHAQSHQSLDAERSVLRGLDAGCRSSIGVHVARRDALWAAAAMVSRPDGSSMIRHRTIASTAMAAAGELLDALVRLGARELMASELRGRG